MKKTTVIKAGTTAAPAPNGLSAFQPVDMLAEVRQTLARARSEADRIVARARQEAELIGRGIDEARRRACEEGRAQGHEEGLRQGREAGRIEALEQARTEFASQQGRLVEACRRLMASINEQKAAWEAAARRDLVDLAMAIARRVVHHVGERDRQVVAANLEHALQLVGAKTDVTVRVNPRDAETARLFGQNLAQEQNGWRHVRIVEDPEVTAGGCRIHWDTGGLDASLDTQLARIDAAMKADGGAGE